MADAKISALAQGTVPLQLVAVDNLGASVRIHAPNELNIKDFGALGDGSHDDTTAIQACFNAAYGAVGSENSAPGRYSNKAVYIPAGHYKTTAPLYLNKVDSTRIHGDGSDCTTIDFQGNNSQGNTIPQGNLSAPDWATAKAVTPVIMTNGFGYSIFDGIGLSMNGGSNSAGFYLFWNGTGGGGVGPTRCNYRNVLVQGAVNGFLIGYVTQGECSEQVFQSCVATNCAVGFHVLSSNSLNIILLQSGMSACGVGVQVDTGSCQIIGCDFANTTALDIKLQGGNSTMIMGCRTETNNFVDVSAGGVLAHISSCVQIPAAGSPPSGYFLNVGNSSQVTIDACRQVGSNSTVGVIQGSNGLVSIRNSLFDNPSFINVSLGSRIYALDWGAQPNKTVANLLTPADWFKGLRMYVTDSTVAGSGNFGAIVAGGGGNIVPVYCDGTNWRIG